MDSNVETALRLHRYLLARHWDGRGLRGPDPGIRFNYRIGRFIKSYLSRIPWHDDYYYLQAQGYWVLGNWQLFALTGEPAYRALAVRASRYMLTRWRADGAWLYPHPEWRGRIATAEGTWAALGLLETYRQTGDPVFLDAARRWHAFLLGPIGFQRVGETLAVNYFAGRPGPRVPNNSAFVLRFLAELAAATGDPTPLQPCAGLLAFLRTAQMPTGEFPYAVRGVAAGADRPHFQCYQYNAFQCLDLTRYYQVTGDATALPLIRGVLGFLPGGLGAGGCAFYQCGNHYRTVTYHAAALAAAFSGAQRLGLPGYAEPAARAFAYVRARQRPDGSFPYSRGDYHLLHDGRSYPRYLAMILYHLLPDALVPAGRLEEAAPATVR